MSDTKTEPGAAESVESFEARDSFGGDGPGDQKRTAPEVGEKVSRYLVIERTTDDVLTDWREEAEKTRTLVVTFSTDSEVMRGYGFEVLDHSDGAVDLDRILQAGSLLCDHDWKDVVGTIEKAWIGDDRRGRALVRFGRSARAEEVFQDVLDGIRRTISVSYFIHELKLLEERKDGDVYIITRWEPIEISLVAVPADVNAVVGRDMSTLSLREALANQNTKEAPPEERCEEEPTMPNDNKTITPDVPQVDVKAERASGAQAERQRINGLRQVADKARRFLPDIDELRTQFENSDRGVGEFQALVVDRLDAVEEKTLKQRQGEGLIDMPNSDRRQYSLTRFVAALVDPSLRKHAGLELEASEAVGKMLGREPTGGFVPLDVLADKVGQRTSLTAGAGTGDQLIATEHWADEMIQLLRNKSVCAAMGARVIPGLVGDVDIPRHDTGAAFAWINNETYSGSDETVPVYTSVNLSPSTLRGRMSTTRKMLKQSSPAIEAMLRDDLRLGIGVAYDTTALNGSGTAPEPQGIIGMTNVGVTAIGTDGGALTWPTIVALESGVAVANADMGSLGYVTNAKVRGDMKTILKAAAVSGWLMADDGTVNGYKCGITNSVPSNMEKGASGTVCSGLVFGNWGDLLLPMWGGVDIEPDKITLADAGGIVLRVFLDADVKVRRTQSFYTCVDITTTA